ncbi:unnamed protein product [Lupinus luteus]|uniref:HMA domain-containing protein n=1 Tax=Lupinus luteus TaxID=3873 RepID=A0AAV1X5Q2_LUPLU
MKHIDIFCASQASTAICLSMDPEASCSSSNTIQLGGKAIDRYNPIISDSRRTTSKSLTTACSSSSNIPIDPKPYHELQDQKAKKDSSSKPNGQKKKKAMKGHDQKKKSTAERVSEHVTNSYCSKPIDSVMRRSWLKPHGQLLTPGSTRCLLSDMNLVDGLLDNVSDLALAMANDSKKAQVVHQIETIHASKPSTSSLINSDSSEQQVVELRVSLHCKGCEGKVKKHLSRMKGVTSFNIDFKAKKVTVVGDVTPLSVLASISKVKNAQFWPASASVAGSGFVETRGNFYI